MHWDSSLQDYSICRPANDNMLAFCSCQRHGVTVICRKVREAQRFGVSIDSSYDINSTRLRK